MSAIDHESIYRRFIDALLKGDRAQCDTIIQARLTDGVDILDIFEQFFHRSLYQIGDSWAKNKITVADEHIATAIIESLINQLIFSGKDTPSREDKVIVSCLTSDRHQIGAKMVAGFFEIRGWDTYFLGADMPLTDLIKAIEKIQPKIVCLSVVLLEHAQTASIAIQEIQSRWPDLTVLVGGGAFQRVTPATLDNYQRPNIHLLGSLRQLEQFIHSF